MSLRILNVIFWKLEGLQVASSMTQEVLTKGFHKYTLNFVFTHGHILIWEHFTDLNGRRWKLTEYGTSMF